MNDRLWKFDGRNLTPEKATALYPTAAGKIFNLINNMIKVKATCCLLLLVLLMQTGHAQMAKVFRASSPDRSTVIETGVSKSGQLLYRLFFDRQLVINWSALGITPSNNIGEIVAIKSKVERSNRQRFAWPLGESDTITNDYTELMLSCVAPSVHYNFIARAQ